MKSFMEEEIFEQKKIIGSIVNKYTKNGEILIDFPSGFKKIKFIASGSSYNCARLVEKFFRDLAGLDGNSEFSSEFLANKNQKISPDTLYFFISQSGKTTDTLEAMRLVRKNGAKAFVLVNQENSPMYLEADYKLNIEAGVEHSIAATKSFSASVLLGYLCALKLNGERKKYLDEIENTEEDIKKIFDLIPDIKKSARFLSQNKCYPIIGYNYYYIIAKEGSLKIKETSYSDSNAYALGEFIHGHIALLNEKHTVVEIFTHELGEFERRNLKKITDKYHPKRVTITDFEDELCGEYKIIFPQFKSELTKFISITIILQLLALHIAYELNMDVDKPTGLNKVVEG